MGHSVCGLSYCPKKDPHTPQHCQADFDLNIFFLHLSSFKWGEASPLYSIQGISQGHPLSQFIFLLCMEYLSAQIKGLCDSKQWTRVKASSGGPSFFHIFIANDLMLFAKANTRNCETIFAALGSFYDMAGQKVSRTKSRIFFLPNVNMQIKMDIC